MEDADKTRKLTQRLLEKDADTSPQPRKTYQGIRQSIGRYDDHKNDGRVRGQTRGLVKIDFESKSDEEEEMGEDQESQDEAMTKSKGAGIENKLPILSKELSSESKDEQKKEIKVEEQEKKINCDYGDLFDSGNSDHDEYEETKTEDNSKIIDIESKPFILSQIAKRKSEKPSKLQEIELSSRESLLKSKKSRAREIKEPLLVFRRSDSQINLNSDAILKQIGKPPALNSKPSEDELQKQKIINGREKVQKAVNRRKILRYVAFFTYLVLVMIILIILCKFLMINSSFTTANQANLEFIINNCSLLITDPPSSSTSSPVYITYQVPTQLGVDSVTTVTVDDVSNPQVLEVSNGLDPRYCSIQLFIQEGVSLGSLQISCSNCNITQDTSFQLQIANNLNITGEVIFANFRDIQVQSINYQAITGYLQLNNIDSTASNNTITMSNEGDIIIQSTQNFRLSASSDTQAFCLSAPTLNNISITNCSISGQDWTNPSKNNPNCSFVYDICDENGCNTPPSTMYTVISNTGNIYANLIPSVGSIISTVNTDLVKGQVYDDGIDFSPETNATISGFDALVSSQTKGDPFIILNLGNVESRSSKYAKWVIASAPAYSLMRPYWIGTFSASILNGYVQQTNGFLLPGICPFYPEYTTTDLLNIQNLISSKITTPDTLSTVISDRTMPPPPSLPTPNTGIFPSIDKGNPFDYWFSLSQSRNGDINLNNNDYTTRPEILAAVIISMVIAAYVAYLLLTITVKGINVIYIKLVNFANHLENYAELEKSKLEKSLQSSRKPQKTDKNVTLPKYTLANILHNAPSPSAFIDYFFLILYRQFSSSVRQFYHLLFRVSDPENSLDNELDPTLNMIKGTELKVLYEKFCFMNHIHEEKLTDPQNLMILKEYGFEVVTREDLVTEVFTKIRIKEDATLLANATKQKETSTSLELYIKQNVELTNFEEDQVEMDRFISLYQEFCFYNRLTSYVITPSVMKENFNINLIVVPQQFIMRIKESEAVQRPEQTWFQRISGWWKPYARNHDNAYVIDISKLQSHLNLVMEKVDDLTPEQLDQATLDLILYPRWWLWDAITVLAHLVLSCLITVPIIVLVILNESQYEPWSLKNPSQLIRFQDIMQDPAMVIVNLFNSFTWNVVFTVLVCILLIIDFFDHILYQAVMEFPQDKSFKRAENETVKGFWYKRSRQLQWILMLFSLTLYFGFFGLLLTWLLLGAFINPTSFLPFASAAVTFVTFVVTKYQSFKDLSAQGTQAILQYVEKLFGSVIHKVLDKMVQSIENTTANFVQEKLKSVVESDSIKNLTTALENTGIIDASTVAAYTNKIENLKAQTIMNEMDNIVKDPKAVLQEIQNVGIELKTKTIDKVKNKCLKRGIPPKLVDLVLGLLAKDKEKTKDLFEEVINEYNTRLGIPKEGAEIIIELLFPEGITTEETVIFIMDKVIRVIFNVTGLEKIQGLNPELLINAFNIFKNLEGKKLDSFVGDLKNWLGDLKKQNPKLSELDPFMPTLDIISNLANEYPDNCEMQKAALKLFKLVISQTLLKINNNTSRKALEDYSKFLPIMLMFAGEEVIYDLETEKILKPQDILKIISNFCNANGIDKDLCNDISVHERFVPDLIYLLLSYIKGEIHEMPSQVIRDIQGMFNAQLMTNSSFVPFCFNLSNVIFNNPYTLLDRVNKCVASYGFDNMVQQFFRFFICFPFEDYESQFLSTYWRTNIVNNFFFAQIARSMKIPEPVLLNMIELVCDKTSHLYEFVSAQMNRMKINSDNYKNIIPFLRLFLNKQQYSSMQFIIRFKLNFEYGHFLLVGKGLLNPKFIPRDDFIGIGVTNNDLIAQKDTIYYATSEEFRKWKTELKKNITATVTEMKKLIDSNQGDANRSHDSISLDDYERFNAQANLVKVYLTDWDTFTYSKPNLIALINALDNPDNKLKKQMLSYDNGSSYNGVDLLAAVMTIKELKLDQGKRYSKIDRKKDSALRELAEHMSISPEPLKNIVQMLVLDDQKAILSSFLYFFPDFKKKEEEIKKIIAYSMKQVNTVEKIADFIKEDLPGSIKSGPTNKSKVTLDIPYPMLRKTLSPASTKGLITDSLEVASQFIEKLNFPLELREKLLMEGYTFHRFIIGCLDDESMNKLLQVGGKSDPRIRKLFDAFSQGYYKESFERIINLFEEYNHPIRVSLAFFGVLNRYDVKVEYPGMPKKESQNFMHLYLGQMLNVHPEAFDALKAIQLSSKAPSLFIQKMFPTIRRINASSSIDVNLIESLFLLSLAARHFNSNYLASKLGVPSDTIGFFVSLMRLALPHTRQWESRDLPIVVEVKKALPKLKIKYEEFVALVWLMFGHWKDIEDLRNIMKDLGLKTTDTENAETKEAINLELFQGMVLIKDPIKKSVDIFKNKQDLASLEQDTKNLFVYLKLATYGDYAFFITRLRVGNFLVIREYQHLFELTEKQSKIAMALCGLLNPSVDPVASVNEDVEGFVTKLYSSPHRESPYEAKSKILPNNTLSYAIALAYHAIDLTPKWAQAFIFDKEAFESIEKKIPDLTKEFLLTVVLYFIHMPDTIGDILGLYEWAHHGVKIYKKNVSGHLSANVVIDFIKKIDKIYSYFAEQFTFEYDKVKELANQSKILENDYWKKLFEKPNVYNKRVNRSVFYLLALKLEKTQNEKQNLARNMKADIKLPPMEFIKKLAKNLYPRERAEWSDKVLGKLIKQIIVRSYKVVKMDMYQKDKAAWLYHGCALTDLCILRAIVWLRNNIQSTSMPRQLYNLNQLMTNLERKLFYSEVPIHLPKFVLMKLAGVSMGLQISNITEWTLPRSLLVDLPKDDTCKHNTHQLQLCKYWEMLGLGEDKNKNGAYNDNNIVGDIGLLGGTLSAYNDHVDELLISDNWDDINMLIKVDEKYLCRLEDDVEAYFSHHGHKELLTKIRSKDNKVYYSREVLYQRYPALIKDEQVRDFTKYDYRNSQQGGIRSESVWIQAYENLARDGEKNAIESESKTNNQNNLDRDRENIQKTLEESFKKAENLERALNDPNMRLLLKVIEGENSEFLVGDHALIEDKANKTKAKLYMALLGLHSFGQKNGQDRALLTDCLNIMSNRIGSDISKLGEILTFLVTGQRKHFEFEQTFKSFKANLPETIHALEIDENILDFLFMALRAKDLQNDNEEEKEEKKEKEENDPIVDAIQKTLNLPKNDLETFTLIRNVFLLKKYSGWISLIEKLITKDDDRKDKMDHPLIKWINLINFKNMKKTLKGKRVELPFKWLDPKYSEPKDAADLVFREIFLKDKIAEKFSDQEKEFFIEAHKIMVLLVSPPIRFEVCERLVLFDHQEAQHQENEASNAQGTPLGGTALLEKILELFGSSSTIDRRATQNGIKLLKLLWLVNEKAVKYEGTEAHKKAIQTLINDMTDTNLFTSLAGSSRKKDICQLFLGLQNWNMELIIKSFAIPETMKEGYLLYSLYGILKAPYLLALGKEHKKLLQTHFRAFLSVALGKLVPKSDSKSLEKMVGEKSGIEDIMTEDLGNLNSPNIQKVLQEKISKLFQDLDPVLKSKKAYVLSENIKKAIEKPTTQVISTFTDIIYSACDGTIATKLLNTFVTKPEFKSLVNKLMRFIMLPIVMPFKPTQRKKEDEISEKNEIVNSFKSVIESLKTCQIDKEGWQQELWSQSLWTQDKIPHIIHFGLLFRKHVYIPTNKLKKDLVGEVLEPVLKLSNDNPLEWLLIDIMNVMLGFNVEDFLKGKTQTFGSEEKKAIFLSRIVSRLFEDIDQHLAEGQLIQLYHLFVKITIDFSQSIKDLQKTRDVVKDIVEILSVFNLAHQPLLEAVFSLLDDKYEGCREFISILAPDIPMASIDSMISFLSQVKDLLGGVFTHKVEPTVPALAGDKEQKSMNSENWAIMVKKIKEGTASSKDLFKMVDEEGDKSESISQQEFNGLANRLGLKLSQHRIKEIFAKVKGDKVKSGGDQDLNEAEFEKALHYLQEKNLNQALQLLGITPEILGAILIRLTILLVLIFIFIFLGIKAFAIGGTFGSIVNSLFPVAGGVALNQDKGTDKNTLKHEKVCAATDTGFKITTSEQL